MNAAIGAAGMLGQSASLITYGLLSLALIALWSPARWRYLPGRVPLWTGLFVLSLVCALWAGFITPLALPFLALLAGATYVFSNERAPRAYRTVTGALIVILSAGLMAHVIPGFRNYQAITDVVLSPGALPYRQYLNYDKATMGLFLLGCCVVLAHTATEWRALLRTALPWAVGMFALLAMLALALGYVRLDPKLPSVTLLWVWINLWFTCVPEEALFRGFIQRSLEGALSEVRHGQTMALIIAAVLFGLSHFARGPRFIALATIAGWGYGRVYQRTGAIEASILVHFVVNGLHFVLFTYPALK
jgi:CAAX protease family protein